MGYTVAISAVVGAEETHTGIIIMLSANRGVVVTCRFLLQPGALLSTPKIFAWNDTALSKRQAMLEQLKIVFTCFIQKLLYLMFLLEVCGVIVN